MSTATNKPRFVPGLEIEKHPEMLANVMRWWNGGLSAGKIAWRLGEPGMIPVGYVGNVSSRNSIIGIINRLRDKGYDVPPRPRVRGGAPRRPSRAKPNARGKTTGFKERKNMTSGPGFVQERTKYGNVAIPGDSQPGEDIVTKYADAFAIDALRKPVTFEELKLNGCRWPVGDSGPHKPQMYCGDTCITRKPYCALHCRR